MTHMSIRVKISLSVGLIIFIALGISSYSYVRLLERDYLESIEWNSGTLAQILVNEIIEMYTYVPNMQNLLEGLTVRCMELYDANKERNISYIAVINASGIIAAHSNRDMLGEALEGSFFDERSQDREQRMILERGMYRVLVPVFGTQENVYIASVELGVPRRIVDEKIGQAIRQTAKLFIIFVTAALLAVSLFVHILIAKPIRRLVTVGEKLAKGEIKEIPRRKPGRKARHAANTRDEIRVLTGVFYEMTDYLQEKADIADRISVGDIRQEVLPRSDADILGNAFQRMSEYLYEMTTVATAIAVGDLRQEVQMKSDYDMLGNSFREMIAFIRHVAEVTDKISEGDLRVSVTPRSAMDVLNLSLQKMVTYIQDVANIAQEIAHNNLHVRIRPKSDDDILNNSLEHMLTRLQTAGEQVEQSLAEVERQNWLRTGQVELSDVMRGEQDARVLANSIVTYIAKYLHAHIGVLYLAEVGNGEAVFQLTGSYAYALHKSASQEFRAGEGIIGQAALTRKTLLIADVPKDHISIQSGLGRLTPRSLLVTPLIYDGDVRGVLELGSAHAFSEQHQSFLAQVQEKIAMTIHSTQARIHMQRLLTETQQQAETLQNREKELRQANEGLEEQTRALKRSEDTLQTQQEELRQTNESLTEQAHILDGQKLELQEKNHALEHARQLVEEKMRELEISERYKSDFLANMSHELRTPLNSLLILAQLLHDNTEGNLNRKQVDHARTIHEAGTDLLDLLNEVLDLSKVETGKMKLNLEDMSLAGLATYITQHFTHVAEKKGLSFQVDIAENVPSSIHSDRQRVEQIIRNLLSNALKFTERGEVRVHIYRAAAASILAWSQLSPRETIGIAVSDTGSGIPENKQQLIFEAFQQLDGTISRKYGGTGLGLSISRELAQLLGGGIHLDSEPGKGSTFTLYLPEECPQSRAGEHPEAQPEGYDSGEELQEPSGIDNIRDDRHDTEASDAFLLIVESEPERAKVIFDLVRERGFKGLIAGDGEAGLHLAYQYKPQAIVLNLSLPRMDGRTVMDKLRKNPETRHIPIHTLVSPMQNLRQGADETRQQSDTATTLPAEISPERLQDELMLFLHTMKAGLPGNAQKKGRMSHDKESVFRGKTILLVDDDIRNSYALKSALEEHTMQVILAGNGEEALSVLGERQEIDLVLMDVMMPVMDGYDATRAIRKQPKFQQLPVIALTAKTKRGERQRCIETGANDYVSKPVDMEKLLSLLRVWLY